MSRACNLVACCILAAVMLTATSCSLKSSSDEEDTPRASNSESVQVPTLFDVEPERNAVGVTDKRAGIFTARASSIQGNADWAKPELAVDGDMSTRWSSEFSDLQWIEVDLGDVRELAGLVLRWEAAYAESYDVLTSLDGQRWSTVYSTARGDGGVDDIYFYPHKAAFVRIAGKKRGTGFGYSLWEVTFKGPDEAVVLTASSARGRDIPDNVLEPAQDAQWHSGEEGAAWLQADFGTPKTFGVLSVAWGDDYARNFEVTVSDDAREWRTVFSNEENEGGVSSVYFEPTTSRYLRIVCNESETGKGFSVRALEVGTPGEGLSLRKFFEIAAERVPGCYPRWMSRQQAFWTIVGVPDDEKESIFCEDGTIEHHKRGFTLMPFLHTGGKLISRDDAAVTQSLENNYLPIPSVRWSYEDLNMQIQMFAYGKPGESAIYTRYRIRNEGKENVSGSLFLLLRPFQLYPPWQGEGEGENEDEGKGLGGFSRISSIRRTDTGVNISGKYHISLLTEPDDWGTTGGKPKLKSPYRDTLVDDMRKGVVPEGKDIDDPDRFASALFRYNFELEPGDSRDVYVAMPLHRISPLLHASMEKLELQEGFEGMFRRLVSAWEAKVDSVEIDIPEVGVVDTLKANVAYSFVTKDGPSLQPGSWCYDKSWVRDGTVAAVAFLRMGLTNEARAFIDWYTGHQYGSGEIPCVIDNKAKNTFWEGISEYDSQGQFIYGVLQYYKYTGDREFLEGKLTNVVKALQFAQQLREKRITPEYRNDPDKKLVYGLISKSYANHNYYDNLWTLKAWKDGKAIAEILGRDDLMSWMDDQYRALRDSVYASMKGAMAKHGLDYIPEYPEGTHFWASSIAIGVSRCGELENMPQPGLAQTMDKYYAQFREWTESGEYRFTPEEMPIVETFLYMGQKDRAIEYLRFMLAHRKPIGWKQWPEVVNSDERKPTIFGDMPHTWVSAQYIIALMSMLLYEEGDTLVLGAGIPEEWVLARNGVSIRDIPTHFGGVSYSMQKIDGDVRVSISGEADPPDGFILRSPLEAPLQGVFVDGVDAGDFSSGQVVLRDLELPLDIVLLY